MNPMNAEIKKAQRASQVAYERAACKDGRVTVSVRGGVYGCMRVHETRESADAHVAAGSVRVTRYVSARRLTGAPVGSVKVTP